VAGVYGKQDKIPVTGASEWMHIFSVMRLWWLSNVFVCTWSKGRFRNCATGWRTLLPKYSAAMLVNGFSRRRF